MASMLPEFVMSRGPRGTEAESVRRVVGLSEPVGLIATPAPMKAVGGPPHAIAGLPHPSGIL